MCTIVSNMGAKFDNLSAALFGKTRRATRKLSEQFERRMVTKVYWACVAGQVNPPADAWRDYVRKVPGEARAEVLEADHTDAQVAVLNYRTLGSGPWGSWLELQLETGRTHQIRIHFASIGHPLAGDRVYGFRKQRLPLRRQFLHAARIAFTLPSSGEPLEFTSELPDDQATVLDDLRRK